MQIPSCKPSPCSPLGVGLCHCHIYRSLFHWEWNLPGARPDCSSRSSQCLPRWDSGWGIEVINWPWRKRKYQENIFILSNWWWRFTWVLEKFLLEAMESFAMRLEKSLVKFIYKQYSKFGRYSINIIHSYILFHILLAKCQTLKNYWW